jgi:hypothetical protein
MKVEITEKYVVYETISIMGGDTYAIKPVEFSGWVSNSFDTEKEAVEAIVKDNLKYQDYLILKQIYLR